MGARELAETIGVEYFDIRGLGFDDERRRAADTPRTSPIAYVHMLATRWYFDASEAGNEEEAARVALELVEWARRSLERPTTRYLPCRVVVDNFGGHVVGRLDDSQSTVEGDTLL